MSKVRVAAKNADGTGCIIIYPSPKPEESPMGDDAWYTFCVAQTQNLYGGLNGPHVDTDTSQLPPMDQQSTWKISGGAVINAP